MLLWWCICVHRALQVLQQQYGSIHSSVAALSSLQSPSDLCAAIADASTHAALQTLAVTAASEPQQTWLAQAYKVGLTMTVFSKHSTLFNHSCFTAVRCTSVVVHGAPEQC